MDTPKRRVWGERRPKDRVTLQIILVFTFTPRLVCVYDKYLHWPRVSVKKIYIHCNRISVSVKNLDDLHLHEIYMPYIRLLTLICTTLVVT